jgi:O-succinylbenzoate synthase
VRVELKEPFATRHGRVHQRRVLLLTLQGEGLEGWGECVVGADPAYGAESVDNAWRILADSVLPRVVGAQLEVVRATRGSGSPMALATVEMAAWDLFARVRDVSLSSALGGTRERVPVGISLGLSESVSALESAVARALDDGYARVKLKIERGRDVEVVQRIRERFPDATLSADANCAYTLDDVSRLKELDALDLQMLEQPLAADDRVGHARLQEQLRTPICLDESIASEKDASDALELGSCRVVNLKPGRLGGLAESRRIHDLLSAGGVAVWCGGMLETGIGRAHNLALASLPGFTLPGDISASRRYWARDIVAPEHEVADGHMRVPVGPGMGVEVDVERVESLTARVATLP